MLPDVYFYNPTCEIAVANGSENYMPKNLLRQMEYDLDLLPAYFANNEDILLVQKYPDPYFLESLHKAGLNDFNLLLLGEALKDPVFLSSPKGFLKPWGWSPAMHKLFSPLKPSCSREYLDSPVAQWNSVHKHLYSRKMAGELLRRILESSNYKFFIPLDEITRVCVSHEEICSLQKKWTQVIVKSPWSSSGRGIQILRPGEYNQTNFQVISGFLRQQGYVTVEPFYNKVQDFSFQFYSKGNGQVEFLGICFFNTGKSGRFAGIYLEEIPFHLDPSLVSFLSDHLKYLQKQLNAALNESLYSSGYQGWIGIDSMIYKEKKGNFMIQPCLEVNCRYTMGAIALAFRKKLEEESGGFFNVLYRRGGELQPFYKEQKLKNPLQMENNKITKGFLSLTPVTDRTNFGASLTVYRR
jgi:hypothetical protein